jgi:CheY-like chemotaxis protein
VDDLLDLAKVEAGKLEVKAKSFKIGDLFGALRGMLKPLLADSSLNLVFEAGEDLPALFTDEQKVSQILRNFISNAIKFTSRGEVRVTARLNGTAIEFAVTDTGVGISLTDQQIIFEEFGQVENSMQKRVKGTGLGLPLSRKLAELLGGAVTVQSEVGIGSTFCCEIPAIYTGADLPVPAILPELDPNKKLVLIVEDNHETAFIYSRYLSGAGFQGHAVASVEDARNFLAQVKPSAIILDLLLRAETTWDFLRELKSDDSPIPVLVMSVTDDERKIFGLGADAFLVKPFQPELMIAEIIRLTSDTPRPRILMIDDNEVSRYLLREHIPIAEYEVFEARDGREGILLAKELKPAIIFLDFYMPGLTGIEVLKDIRSTKELAHIPVILHSTKMLDESELNFFSQNTVAIFPKQSLTLPDSDTRIRELMATVAQHARSNR